MAAVVVLECVRCAVVGALRAVLLIIKGLNLMAAKEGSLKMLVERAVLPHLLLPGCCLPIRDLRKLPPELMSPTLLDNTMPPPLP